MNIAQRPSIVNAAPLAEQVAGLIHDVSHSAFSPAADYTFCFTD